MRRQSNASNGLLASTNAWPSTVVLVSWGRYCQTPPALRLSEYLRRGGVKVQELGFFPDGEFRFREWRREGPEFHRDSRPSSRGRRLLRFAKKARLADRSNQDNALWAFLDVQSLLLGWILAIGKRRLFYCIDYSPPSSGFWGAMRRRLESAAIGRIDIVVTVEWAKIAAMGSTTLDRAVLLRNTPMLTEAEAIHESRHRRSEVLGIHGIPSSATVLLQAGGVADDFGVLDEIKASAGLPPDLYFLLMGPDRCSLSDRPPRVISVGEVSDQEWLALLGSADVGLALWTPRASRELDISFNTPLAWNRLYWYLAAGLPVIAGGHDGLREFIAETGAGVFLDEVNAERLAQVIPDVLMRRKELSAHAIKAFQEGMNFESDMDRVAPLVKRFLTNTRDGQTSKTETHT